MGQLTGLKAVPNDKKSPSRRTGPSLITMN